MGLIELPDHEPAVVIATDSPEILVIDCEGTLLHRKDLRSNEDEDAVPNPELKVGETSSGTWAVIYEPPSGTFLFPVDVIRLRSR
ncbi:MAG: hypothetical protein ACI841_004803 [Planctomycetota bacterium]|jgi:hypothetical protein